MREEDFVFWNRRLVSCIRCNIVREVRKIYFFKDLVNEEFRGREIRLGI